MKHIEYAIVDIETTGGNASGSRITEIAIIIHDGHDIIDRFETLVNPEKEIPLPIFALTGIDNDMVRDAPLFGDIAEKVFTMLEERVFVAHNVNFDYSFVRHQLEECGYKWNARKLCTVRMSRKVRPGLRSYSLGKLCDTLDIPIENRHRAGGDADATVILFTRLMEWDTENHIPDMLKKTSKDQRLPPNLPKADFEALPGKPGVYYLRNRAGKIIYVGKAVNLKKRVASHFSGHNINPQRQHFLREIYSVSFEICATELMALLLECIEIKRLWPAYNRALKRFEPKYGLFCYEGVNGYTYLAVGKLAKHHRCIQVFNREYDGIRLLRELAHQFGLDHRLCRYGQPIPDDSAGALPDMAEHNALMDEALQSLESKRPTFAIIDKGRDASERSCVWVEKGNFYAMGYIFNDTDLNTPEDIRDSLTRYYGNHYMMQLIYAFAEKFPAKVVDMSKGNAASGDYPYDDLQHGEALFAYR
ncbi:exonuclease domain-containing protein [Parapedobacter tibetensis]|uniref:exonuclease domain-containing protein n=1 Tax=Parapedobacter tibetensis TaxID=2972951 RepID=UPI00214D5DAD|nr:exonuclease domain-containing protein [Parapedobacter tibetensis]